MSSSVIVQPLRPRAGSGWQQMPSPPTWVSLGYAAEAWYHSGACLNVISAVEVAKDADGIDRGPEYHISISKRVANGTLQGRTERCSSQEAQSVLAQFGMDGGEEDNHVPGGMVRNFWRPVADSLVGLECACKADEPTIVENKGDYTWRGVSK